MEDNNFTVLLQAAISLHEMFTSLMKAGFTEQQALYLTAQSIRPQQESN